MAPANTFKIIAVLACAYLAHGNPSSPAPGGGPGVTGGMSSDPAATGGMTGSPSGTGGMTGYTDATGGMTDDSNSTGGMTGYPSGTYPSGSMTTAAPPSLMSSIWMWLMDVKYNIVMFYYVYVTYFFYKIYCFITYPFVMLVNALGGGERSLSPVESPEEMYQHASTLAERLNLKKQFQQLERMLEELKA